MAVVEMTRVVFPLKRCMQAQEDLIIFNCISLLENNFTDPTHVSFALRSLLIFFKHSLLFLMNLEKDIDESVQTSEELNVLSSIKYKHLLGLISKCSSALFGSEFSGFFSPKMVTD